MQRCMLLGFILVMILFSSAIADDLYRISVTDQASADALIKTGFDAVVRMDGAYLVIAKDGGEETFRANGLDYRLIKAGVNRDELAVEASLKPIADRSYSTVYEEKGLKVVSVPGGIMLDDVGYAGLTPLPQKSLRIVFNEPVRLSAFKYDRAISYDSLIGLIEYDSLLSYAAVLQSFPNRRTATTGNIQTRDWIISKLQEFGLDSIYVDTFTASLGQAYNIVAVKEGTLFPEHEIVLGAHRDAVSGSPGADDNGSGTVATMEMARVMKDVETNMTIKFIWFDAEEQGLYGSWHYADAAAARGDSIVMMLNLDMCAYYENDTQALLYHGADTTYVGIWKFLASSLTGINIAGEFAGGISASDHHPFDQNGYIVAFPFEYEFSTVYHSYRDSTSYMDFDYFTRMVQASVATAYYVDGYYIPTPSIEFIYRDGAPPEVLAPGASTSFGVSAVGTSGGVPVPGTGQIHYKINGGVLQTDNMTQGTPNSYTAILPALSCGDEIEFYLSAEEETEGRIYDPLPSFPHRPVIATSIVTAFADDFESDMGWSISGGAWQRGTPTGGSGDHGGPDPSSAYSGNNVFGYNLNGGYTDDMPERHITTPAIDCSDMTNTHLKFYRWLGVEQSSYDHAYIRISTNGTTWTNVWQNSETLDDGQWVEIDYDISSLVDGESIVYVRFTMGETDGSWTYCGWNIDDLEVVGYSCVGSVSIATTDLPDWTVNEPFSYQLEALGGVGELTWTDKYNDLASTGLTLLPSGFVSGTVTSPMTISFTAVVTDESMETDEMPFSFTINPELSIATVSLPDWTAGTTFNQTLTATGGTPELTWLDKYDDLNGSGLVLNSDGSLTGTPGVTGSIEFTALVVDNVGASDEKTLQLSISPAVEITTTDLPEWTEGITYDQTLAAIGGTGSLTWDDKYDELDGSGLSLSATGQLSGVPASSGLMEFTAKATDQIGDWDEQTYQITINTPVEITTISLPEGFVGEAYSMQLENSGGTGECTWSDMNNDLDGTGLTLSAAGLLSGTPIAETTIELTAGCDDALGSHDEQVFNINIAMAFVCGDANNDENVDLLDILGIISYVYDDPPGEAPDPPESADVNSDTFINLLDILQLIDFVYADPPGPSPDCP